jgi:hypothetical protein
MKKLIVVATLFALATFPAHAETVRTCSSVYGGGEVCGESTTSTTVTHTVVATGASDNQMIKILAGLAISAAIATGLYKLTYKSYILG